MTIAITIAATRIVHRVRDVGLKAPRHERKSAKEESDRHPKKEELTSLSGLPTQLTFGPCLSCQLPPFAFCPWCSRTERLTHALAHDSGKGAPLFIYVHCAKL